MIRSPEPLWTEAELGSATWCLARELVRSRQQHVAGVSWKEPRFRAQAFSAFRYNFPSGIFSSGLGITWKPQPIGFVPAPDRAEPVPAGMRAVVPFISVMGTVIGEEGANIADPAYVLRWHVVRNVNDGIALPADLNSGAAYAGWSDLPVSSTITSEEIPGLSQNQRFGFGFFRPPIPLMVDEGEKAIVYVTNNLGEADPIFRVSITVAGWLEPVAWSADGARATLGPA